MELDARLLVTRAQAIVTGKEEKVNVPLPKGGELQMFVLDSIFLCMTTEKTGRQVHKYSVPVSNFFMEGVKESFTAFLTESLKQRNPDATVPILVIPIWRQRSGRGADRFD